MTKRIHGVREGPTSDLLTFILIIQTSIRAYVYCRQYIEYVLSCQRIHRRTLLLLNITGESDVPVMQQTSPRLVARTNNY
jgi:hypothetical protein